jgi:gliding motility-associated-like protein
MLPLIVLLMHAGYCLSQVPSRYSFYTSDTLQGFDVAACYKEALLYSQQNNLNEYEKSLYIRGKEDLFVEKKYHRTAEVRKPATVPPLITSTCNNLDFETGDYTGWTGGYGYNFNSTTPLTILAPVIWTHGTNYPEPYCAYHTLVTAAAGNDPYGSFPMLDPGGGSYALRLGGEWINLNGPQAGDSCTSGKKIGGQYYAAGETVQQTFLVTTANAMFTYSYAVVLDKAQHAQGECPYFRAEVLDNAGNPIACLQYYYQSDSTNVPAGMTISPTLNGFGGPVFASTAWQSNALNLKTFIGTNVTVRFTAAGCTHGGHFGYAYVDATCSPVQVLASSPEVCLGGTINLTAPGAGSTGTYSWNTMPAGTAGIVGTTTGQTVTLNASGTYQVTVTQAPGCFYVIDTAIAFFPVPTLTATSTNASCSPGNDGTGTVTVTGGNTPYTYSWTTANGTIGAGATTANATALGAGTYTITVTTTNGCSATQTVTVTQPPGGPTVTVAATPASCSPGSDGTCTATVTGGTTPYTYSWTGGTITVGQGTANITSLNGGTYTCTVSTPTGTCSVSATAIVTQPNGPTTASTNTNVACFGGSDGSATAVPTGGTAPLTYAWTTANGTIGGGAATAAATSLTAGTYTFTVSDSKGCSAFNTVTVTQPTLLAVSASGVNATCNGKCNGQVICIPTGGTTTYTFSWTTPTACAAASCSNVCAGTYTTTITDAHGCTATATATVTEPTALVMNMFSKPADCGKPDGWDSVSVSGGTPGYTYSWTPAPGAGATTTAYHLLVPGSYTVTIRDNNGCPDSLNNVVANLPGVVLAPVSTTRDTCFGSSNGSATVTATSGFPAYTYSWTGVNPIGGGQGTVTASGLAAGSYTCTVTDSAHCVSTVVMGISEPTPVTLAPGPPPTICIGACTTLSSTGGGGTPGYAYVWSLNGTPLASATVCPLVTTTYTANCSDSHGCVSPPTHVLVTVYPPIAVVASGTKKICPGSSTPLGSIASSGNGGPYAYSWSPATGLSSTTVANPIASPTANTTYTVTATDGCTIATSMVTISLFPPPVVGFTSNNTVKCAPVCIGFNGTSVPACATASWNFGDGNTGTGCDTANHCYTTAGTYTVTYSVIDIDGCTGSWQIANFINALPVPVAAFSASPQPTTIIDPEIFFTDQSTGSILSWSWNFGDLSGANSSLQNPNYTYPDTGCYPVTLTVIGTNQCPDVVEHPVCIQPYFTFYAPNTFTPNGDGHNDTWSPNGIGIDPKNYHLMMFDRWGNLMWETHTWLEGWDGRANHGSNVAQIDTYVWKVDLKDVFHNKHQYIGHCNIIK